MKRDFHKLIGGRGWIVLAGCFSLATLTNWGAPAKTTNAPSGYLPKGAPSGLRFAQPPKPRPTYLPPLPITPDPQPTGLYDSPSPAGETTPASSAKTAGQPTAGKGAVVTETPKAKSKILGQPKAPATAGEPTPITPEMLLKFFPNGKPAGVEMLLNEPVLFQAPVKATRPSSSATYEVK